MSDTKPKPDKRPYLLGAVLVLAIPAVSYLVGALNMPRPMSLNKTRAAIDREALAGTVLLKSLPPELKNPISANLEDKIEVLGMTVDKQKAAPGQRVEFTFYYRALDKIDEDWQIFVHIDGVNNVYRIHGDHYPAEGKYTTDLWQKGEIIADTLVKYIPLDAPIGRYDAWLGFYIGDTRLKLKNPDQAPTDGSNRIKAGQFNVGL